MPDKLLILHSVETSYMLTLGAHPFSLYLIQYHYCSSKNHVLWMWELSTPYIRARPNYFWEKRYIYIKLMLYIIIWSQGSFHYKILQNPKKRKRIKTTDLVWKISVKEGTNAKDRTWLKLDPISSISLYIYLACIFSSFSRRAARKGFLVLPKPLLYLIHSVLISWRRIDLDEKKFL